jgi:type 1 fimbria pilin
MKKIVAILSVASLFSAMSVSAGTVTDTTGNVVIGGGVVPQLCKVDSVNNATLTLNAASTKLSNNSAGEINVTCNTPTSKLDISVGSGSVVRNGQAAVSFNGGTQGLTGASGNTVTSTSTLSAAKANVKATITAPAGQTLQSSQGGPDYNVTVDYILTP